MPARTVKGDVFTLIIDGQQIVVKHVSSKGKRCRVIAPVGVRIEPGVVSLREQEFGNSTSKCSGAGEYDAEGKPISQ